MKSLKDISGSAMKDQKENNLKESPAVIDKEIPDSTSNESSDPSATKQEDKNELKRTRSDENEEEKDEAKVDTSEVNKKPRIETKLGNKELSEASQESKKALDSTSSVSKNEGEVNKEEDKAGDEHKDKDSMAQEEGSISGKKTSKEPSEPEKPKFVFGAPSVFGSSTTFGSGFKLAASKSSSGNSSHESGKEKSGEPKFGSETSAGTFGSGFSFGTGFGVLKNLDNGEKKKPEGEKAEESKQNLPEDSPDNQSGVSSTSSGHTQLHMQEVESGEELEECLYQTNAKLYYLSDIKTGWKERGVGTVKVNKDKNTNKARLVMRSRGILKVILNLPLVKEFTIHEGFPGSLYSEKFVRIIAVDEDNEPITYALKTGKGAIAKELYECIMRAIPE